MKVSCGLGQPCGKAALKRSWRAVQGYLAHRKEPLPLGPPYDSGYSPTAGSQEGVVSYERGTPVIRPWDPPTTW